MRMHDFQYCLLEKYCIFKRYLKNTETYLVLPEKISKNNQIFNRIKTKGSRHWAKWAWCVGVAARECQ